MFLKHHTKQIPFKVVGKENLFGLCSSSTRKRSEKYDFDNMQLINNKPQHLTVRLSDTSDSVIR